jgi:PAS domain S-box-containing protein
MAGATEEFCNNAIDRERLDRELRESEGRLQGVVSSLHETLIAVFDYEGRFSSLWVAPELEQRYSFWARDVVHGSLLDVVPPEMAQERIAEIRRVFETGESHRSEFMMTYPGGDFWHDVTLSPMLEPSGQVSAVVGFVRDITERKRAEQQIRASLREKEVLLQEIHHRVKNNLQIISSLLDMQSLSVQEPAARQVLQDSRSRVRAMALVHESLYRSPDLATVDVADYIGRVASQLFRLYGGLEGGIELDVQARGVSLNIDTAIPCGLIVNELVSNALKYAFPPDVDGADRQTAGDGRGEIRIEFLREDDGQLTLVVSDDGVGLPEDVDVHNTPSLGLQLVSMLTQQLSGTLQLDRSAGTVFKITFAPLEQ